MIYLQQNGKNAMEKNNINKLKNKLMLKRRGC